MIRAIFLDLDGTLVGATNTVSPRVRTAVAAARERGCEVILCTGRSRVSTVPVADQLGFRGYAVVSNGGVVMHLGTGEVLRRNHLPIPHAVQAARLLMEAGVAPQVYEDAVESARILYHPDFPVAIHNADRQQAWAQLSESLPFAPVCVSSFAPQEVLRPVAHRLAASLPEGCCVEQAGTHATWCVEVHPERSGKGNGLQTVAERLGVSRREILAVGDHINDIKMLRYAGVRVAMGSGLPELQAVADYVTGTLAEDGVAQAIERFVLK